MNVINYLPGHEIHDYIIQCIKRTEEKQNTALPWDVYVPDNIEQQESVPHGGILYTSLFKAETDNYQKTVLRILLELSAELNKAVPLPSLKWRIIKEIDSILIPFLLPAVNEKQESTHIIDALDDIDYILKTTEPEEERKQHLEELYSIIEKIQEKGTHVIKNNVALNLEQFQETTGDTVTEQLINQVYQKYAAVLTRDEADSLYMQLSNEHSKRERISPVMELYDYIVEPFLTSMQTVDMYDGFLLGLDLRSMYILHNYGVELGYTSKAPNLEKAIKELFYVKDNGINARTQRRYKDLFCLLSRLKEDGNYELLKECPTDRLIASVPIRQEETKSKHRLMINDVILEEYGCLLEEEELFSLLQQDSCDGLVSYFIHLEKEPDYWYDKEGNKVDVGFKKMFTAYVTGILRGEKFAKRLEKHFKFADSPLILTLKEHILLQNIGVTLVKASK